MRKILLFLCLLSSLRLAAQKAPIVVKLAPLAAIDEVSFPTIQGGIEFRLNRNISWYNEVGFRYRTTVYERTDTSFLAVKGFKAKTELRYYFTRPSAPGHFPLEGAYMAANIFYTKDVHNASSEYYYQKDSSMRMVDNYGITKTIWGLNFLGGKQTPFGKRFLIDLYIGLGLRFKKIVAVNQEFVHKRDELIEPADVTIQGFKSKEEAKGGNVVLPHLTAGVRVGFKLFP